MELMFGSGRGLGPEAGRVLEDALRTGVMDELPSADQAFFHLDLAPGAQTVGEGVDREFRCITHGRHSLRGRRILSTEAVAEGGKTFVVETRKFF